MRLASLLGLSWLILAAAPVLAQPSLFINEFMSLNEDYLTDEDGDASDWIELYNASESTLSLRGYFLSDRGQDLQRWALPDTLLPAKSYLLVFASGKDRRVLGQVLHTNFSLAAAGEALFLSYRGLPVQEIAAMALGANQSAGLLEDGGEQLVRFARATAGYSNAAAWLHRPIEASHAPGWYAAPFALHLLADYPEFQLRYSLNGEHPTAASTLYDSALWLDERLQTSAQLHQHAFSPDYEGAPAQVARCVVLRAALFDSAGRQRSDCFNATYFIGSWGITHRLPVVSLCIDSLALVHPDSGIFVPGVRWDPAEPDGTGNYFESGHDWERQVHLAYFEAGEQLLQQDAGLRVHGNSTRKQLQKPMRLYARSRYGAGKFKHPFFESKTIDRFDRLVLKPMRSSWSSAGVQDPIALLGAQGLEVDYPASKSVVVYLNGLYWGIYQLQERVDAEFVRDNHPGTVPDSIDLIDHWWGHAMSGQSDDFDALYDFIYQENLAIESNYARVAAWIDLDNFIDYQLYQIFIANTDWPGNNMKCWRERKAGARWRWILHDADAAIREVAWEGLANARYAEEIGFPADARSTLFLRKLLENPGFEAQFIARAQFLLQNHFTPAKGHQWLNLTSKPLGAEINHQINRFAFPASLFTWYEAINKTEHFLTERPCVVAKEMAAHFGGSMGSVENCELPAVPISITKLYPNPNQGAFTLEFETTFSSKCLVEIVDLSGRPQYLAYAFGEAGLNQLQANLTLKPGIYLLRISNKHHTSYQKLFIQP